ncbi:hypothetical protein D5S17_23670 [Pseudonocardiaceae bacterium YIM PH 21723]|nr:hypothetical protein D5S17_23670 [Pseudonocardiaceae bacterium YIM PH 21723]
MNQLEERYRWMLRVLPRWYREERGDEMTEVFLAGRSADRDQDVWPPAMELFSLAALSVRARFGGAGAPPRQFAWGETVRLVALIGLLLHGLGRVYSLIAASTSELGMVTLGQWWSYVPLLVFPLLFLLSTRRFGWARLLGVCLLIPGSYSLATTFVPFISAGSLVWLLIQLPLWVPVLCLLLGFHRDAPTPALRPWHWFTSGAGPAMLSLSVCCALLALSQAPSLYLVTTQQPIYHTLYLIEHSPITVVFLLFPVVLGPIAVLLAALGRARLPLDNETVRPHSSPS